MKRKILAITGTRADYGLMTPIYTAIKKDKTLELDLIVTGTHLLPEFKPQLETILQDYFGKLHFIKITSFKDSHKAMSQSLGKGIYKFASVIKDTNPAIILLQGDRYEMLAGAIVGAFSNTAVVHMSGGDNSGSIDDSIRNAISKFAHIHLTTCKQSTKKLINLGESPKRILEVGEPSLDVIRTIKFIPKDKLAKDYNLDLTRPLVIAIQHPVTTESDKAKWQITQTLEALQKLQLQTIFIHPNIDPGRDKILKTLEFYKRKGKIFLFPNIPYQKFLSLVKIASVMVGNSSSGIIEAPSFKLPVVNIGTRQWNRMKAINVIDVDYDKEEIKKAIKYALYSKNFHKKLKICRNPYGDGKASEKILWLLKRLRLTQKLITKWIKTDEAFL